FRFASRMDILAYTFSCALCLIIGLIMPGYIIVLTRLTTTYVEKKSPVGNDVFLFRVWKLVSLYGIAFGLCFILEFIQQFVLTRTSERIAQRCRSAFVNSVLLRNTIDCDATSGELSNQLSSHVDRMREGLGERISLFIKSLAAFISCCTLSFLIDWRTSLFLIWSGPIYIVSSSLIPKLANNATMKTLRISEEANGIAEECIINVKT
ncbi:hypothetical protein PENTCL1PPCAC_21605, partial [Pristionchus entomophagus]